MEKFTMVLGLVALALIQSTPIDGARLHEGEQCFAIHAGGNRIGTARHVIERSDVDGDPYWTITATQRIDANNFEMQDVAILDGATLQPLRLDNSRNGEAYATLVYGDGMVSRTMAASPATSEEIEIDPAALDANIWGPLLSAIDLEPGMKLDLPAFHYERGETRFLIEVQGEEVVETPTGAREAWLVSIGHPDTGGVTYWIAKDDGTELGIPGERFGQTLLESCPVVE
ncbi:DUF3108 domain-containing protein [Sphingomicrobium sediminis]|uniref:DUF3108 domain-containing protein n=1 Tax=Sphingomicrobium sediminis TaxID=2950949 RepID=A0A9X2J4V7_9SPHN|nr:DUF3108 domain-containing protein [Sphingomicrobium sediminis]MCM8557622.1 DUF3108 domain-containing protein [Sphingomicrobium sediminis]